MKLMANPLLDKNYIPLLEGQSTTYSKTKIILQRLFLDLQAFEVNPLLFTSGA